MAALQDVNEIKVLGLMLLLRLGQLAPTTVVPRLDDAAEPLKIIMKDVEVKDDTVKQDLERKGVFDQACNRGYPLMGRRRGDAAFGTPDGGATLQDVDAAAGSGVPSFRGGSARFAAVEGLQGLPGVMTRRSMVVGRCGGAAVQYCALANCSERTGLVWRSLVVRPGNGDDGFVHKQYDDFICIVHILCSRVHRVRERRADC